MTMAEPKPELCETCLAPIIWGEGHPDATPRVTRAAHGGHLPETHWHELQTGMCENGHPATRELPDADDD